MDSIVSCSIFSWLLIVLYISTQVRNEGESKDGSSSEYYDQICNVRLPRGLNPHTVPPEELAASLG
jgi:hypothetical protein